MFKRILVTVIALMLVLAIGMSSAAASKWIKTGNGKPANGRTGPGKDYDFAGYFFYGEAVTPDGQSVNGYTYLTEGAWVMTKFLVDYDPGEYVPGSNKGTNEQSSGGSSSSGKSSGQRFTLIPVPMTTKLTRSISVLSSVRIPTSFLPFMVSVTAGLCSFPL